MKILSFIVFPISFGLYASLETDLKQLNITLKKLSDQLSQPMLPPLPTGTNFNDLTLYHKQFDFPLPIAMILGQLWDKRAEYFTLPENQELDNRVKLFADNLEHIFRSDIAREVGIYKSPFTQELQDEIRTEILQNYAKFGNNNEALEIIYQHLIPAFLHEIEHPTPVAPKQPDRVPTKPTELRPTQPPAIRPEDLKCSDFPERIQEVFIEHEICKADGSWWGNPFGLPVYGKSREGRMKARAEAAQKYGQYVKQLLETGIHEDSNELSETNDRVLDKLGWGWQTEEGIEPGRTIFLSRALFNAINTERSEQPESYTPPQPTTPSRTTIRKEDLKCSDFPPAIQKLLVHAWLCNNQGNWDGYDAFGPRISSETAKNKARDFAFSLKEILDGPKLSREALENAIINARRNALYARSRNEFFLGDWVYAIEKEWGSR